MDRDISSKGLIEQNVIHAAVEDYHLINKQSFLKDVMPFLADSADKDLPVVVHCYGGSDRTGHVLAGWLVHGCGYSAQQALEMVVQMGRDPYEALNGGNAIMSELMEFLRPVSNPEAG